MMSGQSDLHVPVHAAVLAERIRQHATLIAISFLSISAVSKAHRYEQDTKLGLILKDRGVEMSSAQQSNCQRPAT